MRQVEDSDSAGTQTPSASFFLLLPPGAAVAVYAESMNGICKAKVSP